MSADEIERVLAAKSAAPVEQKPTNRRVERAAGEVVSLATPR